MAHKYAHEVNIGAKWQDKPYSALLGLYDTLGAATHTVLVGRKKCPDCGKFNNPECHTHADDDSWAGIIKACGFASKAEALRKGFTENAPWGYSEKRVAANMVISVWNKKRKVL
jgi:hypothetical protein